jgi:hypothetical protein
VICMIYLESGTLLSLLFVSLFSFSF